MTESKTLMQATDVNPNKALWEKGDFTKLAETMRESGIALVDKLGIRPGVKVLDLHGGPHIAAASDAQDPRYWILVRENLRRYVAGEPLLNVVDVTSGY